MGKGSQISQLLTQSEYAAYAGLSRGYVSKLVSRGIIPTDEQGLIDPVAADAARRQRINLRMPSLSTRQRRVRQSQRQPAYSIEQAVALLLYALDARVGPDTAYEVHIRFDFAGDAQGRWALQAGAVESAPE